MGCLILKKDIGLMKKSAILNSSKQGFITAFC